MDCARPFTTVKDLTRNTVDEVEYRDDVYDHQILLNHRHRPLEITESLRSAGVLGGDTWGASASYADGSIGGDNINNNNNSYHGNSPSRDNNNNNNNGTPNINYSEYNHHLSPFVKFPHTTQPDAVKYATETWEEYHDRVQLRQLHLQQYFAAAEAAHHAEERSKRHRRNISTAVTAELTRLEQHRKENSYLPINHTLTTDYNLKEAAKMRQERQAIEEEEVYTREQSPVVQEHESRQYIQELGNEDHKKVLGVLEAQRIARIAEEALLEAKRAAEEAERLRAEQARRQAAEEAEKAKREAIEEAKRLERKRREEERKAKAKQDRQARQRKSLGAAAAAAAGKFANFIEAGKEGQGAEGSNNNNEDNNNNENSVSENVVGDQKEGESSLSAE
eukprot:Tbor_TRINITY_DN5426_c3_g2::TRINITY_DN5426_c3_g2_i1::g.25159::m.25159